MKIQGNVPKVKMHRHTDANNVFRKISHITETKNLDISVLDDSLPKFICTIDLNYSIGSDSDHIYLFNENLKNMRSITLIDALETTRTTLNRLSTTKKENKVNLLYRVVIEIRREEPRDG